MRNASFRTLAVLGGVLALVGILASQAIAADNGSPNILAHYDPGLVKAMGAYGPLFSSYIPRSNAEQAAPGDFVEKIVVPDGGEIRVLVKAPAPAEPGKILKVAPIASRESANDYFDRAIKEAISGRYAAVIFPKAVYDFVTPPPASPSHWLIKDAKDLTLDGQGSTLNFASPVIAGVTIGSSQRIIFKNFNIDWPNELMASIGTIASTDNARHTMRIKIEPKYHVDADTHIVALSRWDAKSDPKNPHLALKDYLEQYTNNAHTVYLGDHTFEVPYWNVYLKVGDVMMIRHWGMAPWKNAIQTGASYNIDFENVNVYASPYLGFLLSGGGGYRLSHCSVTRLNPGRLVSSEADAVHVADNVGDTIIEDSTFGYQGDDGINIHGAVGTFERVAANSVHWTAGGESSYAPYSWIAGTETLGFFDGTFGFLGTTSLQSRSNSKTGLSLALKGSAPQGATQLADLSRVSGRFVIRNNKFLFNRARGLLLQSSYGLVENNDFTGQTGHAIVVGAGYGEGPGVQNVIFRGNQFSNVGSFPSSAFPPNSDVRYGAVEVAVLQGAENVSSMNPVHEGLIFDANTFSDLQGPGLFISRANDVVVVNNQFKNTNLSRVPNANPDLNGSIVLTHAHDVYLSKNAMEGAGALWIDPTSTDGIRH
ncbi:MAG: right-handed parallel beta-helix repeat-containing protein [Xanthobacteraceae bacterium]|nr:right-handed parallel beta-helix repeat-containing protein [Xanthobacteraceae bacterium]